MNDTRKERVEMIRAMELLARAVNDENVFMLWLERGVADGDIDDDTADEDIEWYTKDEEYAKLMNVFLDLMSEARKSGGLYSDGVASRPNDLRQFKEVQVQNKHLSERVSAYTQKIAVQAQQIAELQPKKSYYDTILNCPEPVSTEQIAEDYGKSTEWLTTFLFEQEIWYQQGGTWILYKKYAEQGYTKTERHEYMDSDDVIHVETQTYWTQKGRLFLYDYLKKFVILPLGEEPDEYSENVPF